MSRYTIPSPTFKLRRLCCLHHQENRIFFLQKPEYGWPPPVLVPPVVWLSDFLARHFFEQFTLVLHSYPDLWLLPVNAILVYALHSEFEVCIIVGVLGIWHTDSRA